ncbi:MAG: hypothetical protein PHF21_01265 [Bacilli bacterium]|nr:hypothetical protein [Bacilli bacterium]
MKKKHLVYFRLNIMSLFLIAVSFISVTLAWFAYSGLATVDTTVDVKAWHIELEKNGEKISNDIVILLSDIYPGMETKTELINIKNPGDSDAELKYNIVSARILGDNENNYIIDENLKSEYVEDILSHNFPFKVNISLSKNYILSKGEDSYFEISVSWPLDSGNDELDSLWGNKAYNYQLNENQKKINDPNYRIEPSIKIKISLTAEQYMGNGDSSDSNYNLGDELLIDFINNSRCSSISETCIKMYVIDINNTLADHSITLLPNPHRNYIESQYTNYLTKYTELTSDWQVNTRALLIDDLLKVISTDVTHSVLIRDGLSDAVIGNLKYPNRISTEINKIINTNGYYSFINSRFAYLSSADCYWTMSEYGNDKAFSLIKNSDLDSKIYGNMKSNTCKIIPIVTINKSNL